MRLARLLPSCRPRPTRPRARLACRAAWEAVTDAASGKRYYWNRATNETAWSLPAEPVPAAPAAPAASVAGVSFAELETVLLATPATHLGPVAESYRDAGALSDEFTAHLTARIAAALPEEAERLDKLRSRLANPLIRQPPPF